MLLPIALSFVEGCAQSPRSNVPVKYASAQPVLSEPKDRFFARLASEIFLSSLQREFSIKSESQKTGNLEIGSCL